MTLATAYRNQRPKALVATTPDDSHAWNLTGVTLHLEDRGFDVTNLGPCTPSALLAEQIRALRPDLVVLSSINGHGAQSLLPMMDVLMRYQVKHVAPIIAGGLLTTNPDDLPLVTDALRDAGIAALFHGDAAWQAFDAYLSELQGSQDELARSA